MKKNPIYDFAITLFSLGKTFKGSKAISEVLNSILPGKNYVGGRGTFKAIGSAYRKARDAGLPDAWKILEVFLGKKGQYLWK